MKFRDRDVHTADASAAAVVGREVGEDPEAAAFTGRRLNTGRPRITDGFCSSPAYAPVLYQSLLSDFEHRVIRVRRILIERSARGGDRQRRE
jgi:hypothetical protein